MQQAGAIMQQAGDQRPDATAFGFLTAVETPAHGCLGGYLLVDVCGRPLEFHCTTPVKVSRAQQILYGAALPAHLHGRQLGAALLAEGTVEPALVLTDIEAMLHVRPHTLLPVALVAAVEPRRPDAVALGAAAIVPPPTAPGGDRWRGALESLAAAVDLHEPFARIRAAIEEAQRH
ncbi:MAG: hypothetical protein ACOYK7_10405 [Pirellulales bacterium]